MFSSAFTRRCIAAALATTCLFTANCALAQTTQTAQAFVTPAETTRWTLSTLFARAWLNHPAAKLTEPLEVEAKAKRERANSWLAGPPTLDTGIRTDSISRSSRRDGLREIEFEVSTPIATSARRSLQSATATAEAESQRAVIETQRLKLAGEVREAYWLARAAQSDEALAEDEAARAKALATDSARRTRAGETARVDMLQADAAARLAESALVDARGKRDVAFALLTRLLGEAPGDPTSVTVASLADSRESKPASRSALPTHAALREARLASLAARARLEEANAVASEPPVAKLTLANERTRDGGSQSTARIGFSIPFDAAFQFGNFNAPRAAQAARELAQAEAETLNAQRIVIGEIRAAELALATAEARLPHAKSRALLASEAAALYDKAFRIGELDLPTRLRIEGERAKAIRDAARAELEVEHAISRLQQAIGNTP